MRLLKFHVPAASRAAVQAEVLAAGAERERWQATYYDSPDHALATAGFSLCQRRDGNVTAQELRLLPAQVVAGFSDLRPRCVSVQELQGRDTSGRLLTHVEVLQDLQHLDLSRHDGSEALNALQRVLRKGFRQRTLRPTFTSDCVRTEAILARDDVRVQVTLEEGMLQGDPGQPGSLAQVCDVAFEVLPVADDLLSGHASLHAIVTDWMRRHRLWLDLRSMAERGARLGASHRTAAARRRLHATLGPAVHQLLANASDLAAGDGNVWHIRALLSDTQRIIHLLDTHQAAAMGIVAHFQEHLVCDARSMHNIRHLVRSPLFTQVALELLAEVRPREQLAPETTT